MDPHTYKEVTMTFKEFKGQLTAHIADMTNAGDPLFLMDVDKDTLWSLYLESIPPEHNPIFRKRREFDCSCCRHFIKSLGGVVRIKDYRLTTLWDFAFDDPVFGPSMRALSSYVRSRHIAGPFLTKEATFGQSITHEDNPDVGMITWEHLSATLPKTYTYHGSATIPSAFGEARSMIGVFERSLSEITDEALTTVLDIIGDGALYRGEEWKEQLIRFKGIRNKYMELPTDLKEAFIWEVGIAVGPVLAKIRNHSIGVLLTSLSEGNDLEASIKAYEAIVAPTNYRRPKPIYTKKMLEAAKATLKQMGLLGSLERRFATVEDLSVGDILFADRDAAPRLIAKDPFTDLGKGVKKGERTLSTPIEVSIDHFIQEDLPGAEKLSILLEGRHRGNLVSLIAPKDPSAPSLFRWGNPFSWAYTGNITDSMKDRVKSAGGNIDGCLRFSIQWNDQSEYNPNDYDAHCRLPGRREIYYREKWDKPTKGQLDVDIIHPEDGKPAVENITFPSRDLLEEGNYVFAVHCYSHRGGRDGFIAEIEFDGQVFNFEYRKDVRSNETINVATIHFSKRDGFKIAPMLPTTTSPLNMWGIEGGDFHPVSLFLLSPNHWKASEGTGNKHYIFTIPGCTNPERPNGFFNEFLKSDLLPHRKVFEALGGRMHVEDSPHQLSGVGFSETKKDSVVVKVEGRITKILKINF